MQEYLSDGDRNVNESKMIYKARGKTLDIKLQKRWKYNNTFCRKGSWPQWKTISVPAFFSSFHLKAQVTGVRGNWREQQLLVGGNK